MIGEDSLVYSELIKFTYSDFDAYDHILPSSLQHHFQDAAGKHAELLGVGYLDMIRQGALWILSKLTIEILEPLNYDETYTLTTWPHRKRLIYFPREYAIRNQSGRLVAKSISTWHIFSRETRSIMSLSELDLGLLDEVERIPSNFESWQIDFPAEFKEFAGVPRLEHEVTFTELDHNGHMNNTHYSDLAVDSVAMSSERLISSYRIQFLCECALQDRIKTYRMLNNKSELVKGVKDGKEVFIAEINFTEVNHG